MQKIQMSKKKKRPKKDSLNTDSWESEVIEK